MNKKKIIALTDWILPPNFFRLLTYFRPTALWFSIAKRKVLQSNKALYNRHLGERCFILCNGPSVNLQDIKPLRDEVVFSVSSGYFHPDYVEIAPRYHCIPQLTYGNVTTEVAVNWFREMNAHINNAELFLDQQEWEMVQDHGLFVGRELHYVCMGRNHFPTSPASIEDLAGIMPRVQSVPILVVMIALYMGFKEIYLVGTDHDWFVKKEYKYFFEPGLLKGLDLNVQHDGALKTNLWDELPSVSKLWAQYRAVKKMAKSKGVKIYNATEGGMLDEFERVSLAEVLNKDMENI